MFDPKASDRETAGVDLPDPRNDSLQSSWKASPAGVARVVGAWSCARKAHSPGRLQT